MGTCCIVAVARNENAYLNEWIRYHLDAGVDHIHLYDNNVRFGEYWFDDDRVTVHDFSGDRTPFLAAQTELYQSAYDEYGSEYEWIAFIDVDEFITVPDKDIKTFLSDYDDSNLIHLNWRCYGDNGHLWYEDAPVLERFTTRIRPNAKYLGHPADDFVKSFVRGGCKAKIVSQHTAKVDGISRDGDWYKCDCNSIMSSRHTENAYIRHYVTKSLEEYFIRRCIVQYSAFADMYTDPRDRIESYYEMNGYTPETRDAFNVLCTRYGIRPLNIWERRGNQLMHRIQSIRYSTK